MSALRQIPEDIIQLRARCLAHKATDVDGLGSLIDALLLAISKDNTSFGDFRSKLLEPVMNILLQKLPPPTEPREAEYMRKALELADSLVIHYGVHCGKYMPPLCTIYLRAAKAPPSSDEGVRRIAINGLGNLIAKGGGRLLDYHADLLQVFTDALEIPKPATTLSIKIAKVALRGLTLLIEGMKQVPPSMNIICERLASLMMLKRPAGSSDHSRSSSSTHASWWVSDSEYSEGAIQAHADPSRRPIRDQDRCRQNAFSCLSALAKHFPKPLFAFWSLFLSQPTQQFTPSILLHAVMKEEYPAAQQSAILALSIILDTGHTFLSNVTDRHSMSGSSFISLSEKLSYIVHDIHTSLSTNLRSTSLDSAVLAATLKCTASLASSKVFTKLSRGYIAELYEVTLPHLHECPEAISTLASVIQRSADTDGELGRTLFPETASVIALSSPEHASSTFLGILQGISAISGKAQGASSPDRYAPILSAVIHAYPEGSKGCWPQLVSFIKQCIDVGGSHPEDDSVSAGITILCDYTTEFSSELTSAWWDVTVRKIAQPLAALTLHSTLARLCEALSNMSPAAVEGLKPENRIFTVTFLLGMANDEDGNVRASACRSLGIWVSLAHEDELFLLDCAQTLLSRGTDEGVNVRIRASWALANLYDLFIDNPDSRGIITPHMEASLTRMAIAFSGDNDKVRPNGVRILGGILHVSPTALSQDPRLQMEAFDALKKNVNAGTFKLRWNTCYALGRAFENPVLDPCKMPITGEVLKALVMSAIKGKNYKVRINACIALQAMGPDPTRYSGVYDAVRGSIGRMVQENATLIRVQAEEGADDTGYEAQFVQQVIALATVLRIPLPESA